MQNVGGVRPLQLYLMGGRASNKHCGNNASYFDKNCNALYNTSKE